MLAEHLGVEFIYEDQERLIQAPLPTDSIVDTLTPVDLDGIPSNVLAALQEAALEADLTQMLLIINNISEKEPVVAGHLSSMAKKFEYQKILTLLENTRGEG